MATFTTTRTAAGTSARRQEKGVFVDVGTYEASATAAASVLQMVRVAAGVTLLDLYVIHDALGATVTLDVGDGDDVDRYIDGADGNTANPKRMNAATAFPRRYTANDTIDIVTGVAAATGTITLVAIFTAEQVDLT